MRTKTAPVPIPTQGQAPAQEDRSPTKQRQRPEGTITDGTPSTEGRQETQKQDTVVQDLDEPLTQKQISLVQETWGLVKGDLERVGVEFYIRYDVFFVSDADSTTLL